MSTLKELKALGGFISAQPIKKEIRFVLNGEEFTATIHVKRLCIGEFESAFLADKEVRSRTAKAISEGVTLGEDGKERISFEDAYRLDPALAGAMLTAFNEVNTEKKSLKPAKGSSVT